MFEQPRIRGIKCNSDLINQLMASLSGAKTRTRLLQTLNLSSLKKKKICNRFILKTLHHRQYQIMWLFTYNFAASTKSDDLLVLSLVLPAEIFL